VVIVMQREILQTAVTELGFNFLALTA